MTSQPIEPVTPGSLERPVAELLARARPLPSPAEMVIADLDEAEGAAFLATLTG
jgi:hypothetical protein